MLNINAFFEFKQRTRHTYSFQLAQLIDHALHFKDHILPPNMTTETHRRVSISSSNDPVSIRYSTNEKYFFFYFFFSSFSLFRLSLVCLCVWFILASCFEMAILNAISEVKSEEKRTRAGTSVTCFVFYPSVTMCVCRSLDPKADS